MMGLVGALGKRIKGGGRGKGGGGAGGMGVGGEDVGAGVRRNPLQRAKREMAALADVLMAAAQAGQGLNLGIADAFSLSAELLRALEAGGDVGEARVLRAYEGDRKVKNLGMLGEAVFALLRDVGGA
ncbi:hypothetical protein B484DRAFT_407705 [Ochromonadaceae sp. CCMP2298]|nr:hypothetical protein B484DRAFT_407705 [Ochromonadaceae sp. CCMP2298]